MEKSPFVPGDLVLVNGRCIKDGSSNVAMESPSDASTDSTAALVTECPDIIDVDIDSPIEITTSELKYAFHDQVPQHLSDKPTSDLNFDYQPVLSDVPDKRVHNISDITVLNITSVLKNAASGQLSDKFWLKSRKHSPRSRNSNLSWLNCRRNSRTRSMDMTMPGNRSRTRSSDRNLPWVSSRRSRTRSRDRNLSEASQQTTVRCETPPGEANVQQTVMPYEPRVFPLSEEEYNKMIAQTQECNKIDAQEAPVTLECHKMVASETPMTLGCNKIISQDTLVTPESNKFPCGYRLMGFQK